MSVRDIFTKNDDNKCSILAPALNTPADRAKIATRTPWLTTPVHHSNTSWSHFEAAITLLIYVLIQWHGQTLNSMHTDCMEAQGSSCSLPGESRRRNAHQCAKQTLYLILNMMTILKACAISTDVVCNDQTGLDVDAGRDATLVHSSNAQNRDSNPRMS